MQYFFIASIIGLCLTTLLLIVFFKAGKKNKKMRAADLQLVKDCGDESLIRLYEQAESENERDGIVEFIKEKLARESEGLNGPDYDLAPAGQITTIADTAPEALPEEALPEKVLPEEIAPPHHAVPGISGTFAGSAGAEATVAAEHTAYGEPGATHVLALEDINWHAIEEDMKKRREEESLIMAQNKQIQEVFSKIKDIESSLMSEQQDD